MPLNAFDTGASDDEQGVHHFCEQQHTSANRPRAGAQDINAAG
jgi:hypothetical protein